MKKFIQTLRNIYKIEDLRKRILYTLGILLIYRFGAYVVLPGVDPGMLANLQNQSKEGLLGLLNMFSGAIHICFHCNAAAKYGHSIFSETSEGRRKWQKED
jgi:preprotein translocase subunit SecY